MPEGKQMARNIKLKNLEETEGTIYHKDGDSAYELANILGAI